MLTDSVNFAFPNSVNEIFAVFTTYLKTIDYNTSSKDSLSVFYVSFHIFISYSNEDLSQYISTNLPQNYSLPYQKEQCTVRSQTDLSVQSFLPVADTALVPL